MALEDDIRGYFMRGYTYREIQTLLKLEKDVTIRLYPFPTTKKNLDGRTKWKQLVERSDGNKLWSPSKDSRVRSHHFVDSRPTENNPSPTVNMGYEGAEKRVKRMIQFQSTQHTPSIKRKRKHSVVISDTECQDIASTCVPSPDPEEIELPKPKPFVPWIITFFAMFMGLCNTVCSQRAEIKKLRTEILILKAKNKILQQTAVSEKIVQKDSYVSFLPGIATKSLFLKLHSAISPFVTRKWRGTVSMSKNIRRFQTTHCGPVRKLSSKSEFLLMLMKLRLGLTNKDLAKRFDISDTLCSRIFFIDCAEIFLETQKDPKLQSSTWSDYKHHNTFSHVFEQLISWQTVR